jgi:hypothetical protein
MSNTPGNILGNGFDQYVIYQIDIRQQKLGNVNNSMSDNDLIWAHGRNAWLRLASSVDLNKKVDNYVEIPLDSKLAKDNILFGGTSQYNDNGNINLRGGLGAYDISSFGYRPMAAVVGADISYLNNNGTLQKATINIKAYSPEQLEIIDKLYMRLGYSILLEWGHTVYLDNNGNKQEFNSTTDPFIKFFTIGTTQQDMYDAINNEREIYKGNYEAFYGQIVNFNWKFNAEDATYDINVEAISPGQIIESLRINTSLKKENKDTTQNPQIEENKPAVISLKDASIFHAFLYDIYTIQNEEIERQRIRTQQAIQQEIRRAQNPNVRGG